MTIRAYLALGVLLAFLGLGVVALWYRGEAISAVAKLTGFVAQAELDTANAKLAEEQRHRQAATKALELYRQQYAADMAAAEADQQALEERIAANEQVLAAAGRSCTLNNDDVRWLRNPAGTPPSGVR